MLKSETRWLLLQKSSDSSDLELEQPEDQSNWQVLLFCIVNFSYDHPT